MTYHMHLNLNAINLPDSLGLMGVALTLMAYALLQTEKINANSKSYSLINAIASLLIMYSLYFEWNLSAFVMEVTWLLLSIYGLWRAYKNASPS